MDERQYGEDISSQPLPPEYAPPPPEEPPLPDDSDLSLSPEDPAPANESESQLPPEEFPAPGRQTLPDSAESPNAARQKHHRNLKQLFLMPVAASLAAVSILFASVNYDPLGMDLFNGGSSSSSVGETADAAFPKLSNLEPNGPAVGYGVLNEQYIHLTNGTASSDYLEAGDQYTFYGTTITTVPGISYDKSTNTLSLNNFNYPGMVEMNWMGNGLRLEVNGTNSIGHLLIWGFHYGGSITITGSGSLTVNQDPASNSGIYGNQYDGYGIFLQGENSDSCLMIDNTVTLDVYGSDAAIFVQDSSFHQGIYYLSPLTVTGGERVTLPPAAEKGTSCYSFRDPETETLSKHLVFN